MEKIRLAIRVYNAKDIQDAYRVASVGRPVIGKNYADERELDYLLTKLSRNLTYSFSYLAKEYELPEDCIVLSLEEFYKLKLNLDLGLIPFDYEIIRDRGML